MPVTKYSAEIPRFLTGRMKPLSYEVLHHHLSEQTDHLATGVPIQCPVSIALLRSSPTLVEWGLMLYGSLCIVPLISCFKASM